MSMGTGVWSMHFIGMLAFRMPIELGYHVGITGLSLLTAISISYFALHVVTSNELSWRRLMVGGVMMGVGVAGMHYTGMNAAIFPTGSICSVSNGSSTNWLAFTATGSILCILSVTLLVSIMDRRFDLQAYRMNVSLEQANKQLLVLATEDPLTGIPNRSSYIQRAEQAVSRSQRNGLSFTVMFMDLDGFKTINDSLGHSAGDKRCSRHFPNT
ncbi:GGDEF domain-containing protein [Granulicella sp. L60]|uniref:MHYT domain-containing protein n=1 Tax=Granulicella sp. L60 TaxID=1641866 RepID=UPI00131C3100